MSDSVTKVIWIFEENKPYDQIINNGASSGPAYDPNIQQYASDCYSAGEMHNEFHPSQPNYMAATAGTVAGEWNDCGGGPVAAPACQRNIDNIFSQIDHAGPGRSWKAYMEDMTSNCQDNNQGNSSFGNYRMKHNPPEHFSGNTNPNTDVGGGATAEYSLRDDGGTATCLTNDIPMDSPTNSMDFASGNTTDGSGNFLNDLGEGNGCSSSCADALPSFSFIAPNVHDDMHSGTIAAADRWLGFWIPKIEATQSYQQGHLAVFITWDEGSDPQNFPAGCIPPGAGTPTCTDIAQTGVGPFDCTQGIEANNPVITATQPASGGDLYLQTAGEDSPQCHIATIIMSAGTPAAQTDDGFHNHYDMLKTTEELLGLPQIQNNGNVGATNCFYSTSNGGVPQIASVRTTCDQWGAGDHLSGAADFCSSATGVNCGGADTSPPSVPNVVLANANGPNAINVTWSASTDPNDSPTSLHYVVQQSNDGGITYSTTANNVTGTTYTVTTGLAPATTYDFRVAAADPVGNQSLFSAAANVTTPPSVDTTAPTVPGSLSATVQSTNAIALSWTPSSDPDDDPSTLNYTLEESTDGSNYTPINDIPGATCAPTCTDDVTGLTANTLYYFRVSATDPGGNQSLPSTPTTATPQVLQDATAPNVPGGPTATAHSANQIDLTWNQTTDPDDDPSSLDYVLEQSSDGNAYTLVASQLPAANCTPSCTYAVTGLAADTFYYFRVAATDPTGNQSAYSNATKVETQHAPPPKHG